jgi:hypothetical protein
MRGPKLCLPRAPGILQCSLEKTRPTVSCKGSCHDEGTLRRWGWYWTVLKYAGKISATKVLFPMDT